MSEQTQSRKVKKVESLLAEDKKEIEPFKEVGLQTEKVVANISQPSISSISPSVLKGDLDNIILMALRKEADRRYVSVEDLSKDISNYLNGLPVNARPNTFFYRLSKFYTRNKTASIIGLFLALSLIIGIIATTWQAVAASQARDRAEKRFQDVRHLSNSLLFEITPKIEKLQGSIDVREILVKRALEYLDSLANESNTDLQLQSELASAYEKVGELQANLSKPSLNDLTGAIESYRKAQNIRLKLPETLDNQKELAENLHKYSDVVFAQNDIKGSLDASHQSLNMYEKILAENPQLPHLQIAYIATEVDYGATYSSNNQFNEAIPVFQKAIADLARLDQNSQDVQRLTALSFAQLGNALSWDNRQSEAEIEMAKAVKIAENLSIKYPNDNIIRNSSFRTYSLASVIYEGIKNDISLKFAQKGLQIASHAVETDTSDSLAKASLASAYSRNGICLVNVNLIPEAISSLQKAENLFRELIAQEPKNRSYQRNLAIINLRVADALRLQKNYSEAEKNYQNSADLHEQLAKMDDKNTLARRDEAQSLKNVAEMKIKLNQKAGAKYNFQKALQILVDLKSQNALGEFDWKMIDEIQTALQELSK